MRPIVWADCSPAPVAGRSRTERQLKSTMVELNAAGPVNPTWCAGRHDRLFPLEFMRGLALERLGISSFAPLASTIKQRLEAHHDFHADSTSWRDRPLQSGTACL